MNDRPILVLSKLESVSIVCPSSSLKRYFFPFKGALCGHYIRGIIAISDQELVLGEEYLFYLKDWSIVRTQVWGNLGKIVGLEYPASQEFLDFYQRLI